VNQNITHCNLGKYNVLTSGGKAGGYRLEETKRAKQASVLYGKCSKYHYTTTFKQRSKERLILAAEILHSKSNL